MAVVKLGTSRENARRRAKARVRETISKATEKVDMVRAMEKVVSRERVSLLGKVAVRVVGSSKVTVITVASLDIGLQIVAAVVSMKSKMLKAVVKGCGKS